jgi:serine/threonine-protein kinase
MNLAIGQALHGGQYILEAVLGQGGFGITYRATHLPSQQRVVIKTLREDLYQAKEFDQYRQRFAREAQCLARCQHPNIVRILDFFGQGGLPFIVMDYIPGQTLAELIQPRRPLPEVYAVYYIRQVAAALSVVHANGLLHRDVKPQNIIRCQGTHTAVLIDFGIAREFALNTVQTQTGILSAGYAPIEQYLPRGKLSPASDIYALAATLYCLLAGQPPIAAPLRDRVPLPSLRQFQPHLTPGLEPAILQGMAMEVPQRPQTIQAWLSLLPTSVLLPTPSHQKQTASAVATKVPQLPVSPPTPTTSPSMKALSKPPSVPVKSGAGSGSTAAPSSSAAENITSAASPALSMPRRSFSQRLLATATIAACFGAGLGLMLQFSRLQQTLPILQRDQAFPPRPGWPGTVPNATSESIPSTAATAPAHSDSVQTPIVPEAIAKPTAAPQTNPLSQSPSNSELPSPAATSGSRDSSSADSRPVSQDQPEPIATEAPSQPDAQPTGESQSESSPIPPVTPVDPSQPASAAPAIESSLTSDPIPDPTAPSP